MHFHSIAALSLTCGLALTSLPALAQSVLPRKLADKPMAILYARSINEQTAMDYVRDLSGRLDIGESMMKQIERQPKTKTTDSADPVNGSLVYLVQGLIPSIEWVSFQTVVDESEASAILSSMVDRGGDNSRLEEDSGDYRLINHWEWENALEDGQKPEDFGFGQNRPEIAGFEYSSEIVEKDGKRVLKMTQTMTQHFRYFDGFLYNSRYGALTDVVLPTSHEIQAGFLEKSDAGVKLYADRVPQGIRTLAWNMLSATMGTQLQQRDSEDDLAWDLRNSAGQWALAMLRAAIFDIDYGEGEGYLASGREPLRGRVQLRPRRNSKLIKDLEDLSAGRSRFASLLREDSAASIHLCAALPAEGVGTLKAAWRLLSSDREMNAVKSSARAAVKESLRILEDIADDGTVEVLLRIVRSEASGSVILGGVQVGNQANLLDNLHVVFSELLLREFIGPTTTAELVQRHGRPILMISLPPFPDAPVQISHVWIAHRDDCLWFAAGGENAHEMIRIAAERCGESGRIVRTRLLTVKLDLDHWMNWPEEDATGLSRLPLTLDGNESLNPLSSSFSGRSAMDRFPPKKLLPTILSAERNDQKKAWFTLSADKSGLLTEAEVGRALAEFWVAGMLDAQDRMIRGFEEQNREAQEKVKQQAVDSATSTASEE